MGVGAQTLGPSTVAFPGLQQVSGSELEQPGQGQVPIWVVVITSSSFTHRATTLVPNSHIIQGKAVLINEFVVVAFKKYSWTVCNITISKVPLIYYLYHLHNFYFHK